MLLREIARLETFPMETMKTKWRNQFSAGVSGPKSISFRDVDLRLNTLAGSLPLDLTTSSDLRHLYLQGNRFSGKYPRACSVSLTSWGLTSLRTVSLVEQILLSVQS